MSGDVRSGARTLPLAEVQARAARAATGFARLGVAEGDTVALLLRNDVPFLEASLAAIRLGAYPVPINWHGTAQEVGYVLRDSGARVLVAHADLLRSVVEAVPAGLPVLGVPTAPEAQAAYGVDAAQGALPAGIPAWEDWLGAFAPAQAPPRPYRGSIVYTSGTTGHPKGVQRLPMSPEQEQRRGRVAASVFGLRPGARTAITGPLYHSAPNAYLITAARVGASIVLEPRFDAEALLALVESERITHLHMVPTMFVRLLRLPEAVRRRYDLSSLEWVVHGAAPCPPDIKRGIIAWWGPVVREYYGSTESGLNTCISSAEWLERPGSVGRPAPGSAVRILGDDGQLLAPNAVGQVYLRQEALPDFTYRNRDEQRRAMERDGFITVGDLGYLDDAGYLFLCDRRIDMIISGGVNIYPAEIEAVLITMPGLRDCAVFGIPDAEYGERVAAAVEAEPGATLDADAVRAYLRPHLAGYKLPRHVELHTALPREDSGKVFKRKLRAPHWEGLPRA